MGSERRQFEIAKCNIYIYSHLTPVIMKEKDVIVDVNIDGDVDEMMRLMNRISKRQLPFALARSLNTTMFQVRQVIVESTYPRAFTVRNPNFARVLWNVDTIRTGGDNAAAFRSFKGGEGAEMKVMLKQQNPRGYSKEYMVEHATGGVKVSHSGGMVAIPKNPETVRTKTGRVTARKKPMAITQDGKHFLVKNKAGEKSFIARRKKGEKLEVVYVFKKLANIDGKFEFYDDAFFTAGQMFPDNLISEFYRLTTKLPKPKL